jgi:hypothetical protein
MGAGSQVTYQVTGVVAKTEFSPTNTPIPGKEVTFTTSTDYEGKVFIPDTVFGDLAAVRLAVESQVKMVAAAASLSGTVGG